MNELIRLVQQDGYIDDDNTSEEFKTTPLLLLCEHNRSNDAESFRRCLDVILGDERTNLRLMTRCAGGSIHALMLLLCSSHSENGDLNKVIRMLIDNNEMDVAIAVDSHGNTALNLLCQYYGSYDLIDLIGLLLAKGVDNISRANSHGWNALHNLCHNYPEENLGDIIQLLVENGIDENATTNMGFTARQLLEIRRNRFR